MNKQGFSIIETLIAVAIVGIIATAIMAFFPTISKTNQSTRTDQIFTIAAKHFMEDIRSSWTDTTEGREHFDNDTFVDGSLVTDYAPQDLPEGFSCQASISDPDAGAFDPIQRKRVSLSCAAPSTSLAAFSVEFGRPE
jgi:prepilin-type N-terminal cleavage/methylation domain-containing protein